MMAAANPKLYEAMWGPVECQPTGLLKNFSHRPAQRDPGAGAGHLRGCSEVTPVQSKLLADRLPDARWVLFQHSSHSAILEEPELHWSLVHDFLDQIDDSCGR